MLVQERKKREYCWNKWNHYSHQCNSADWKCDQYSLTSFLNNDSSLFIKFVGSSYSASFPESTVKDFSVSENIFLTFSFSWFQVWKSSTIHFTCHHLCVIQDIFRTLHSYLFNTYQQKTIYHQRKKCLLISLKVLVKWDRETKELKKKKTHHHL